VAASTAAPDGPVGLLCVVGYHDGRPVGLCVWWVGGCGGGGLLVPRVQAITVATHPARRLLAAACVVAPSRWPPVLWGWRALGSRVVGRSSVLWGVCCAGQCTGRCAWQAQVYRRFGAPSPSSCNRPT
jgi:hypothetical protein